MPLHELTLPFEPPSLLKDRLLQGAEYLGAGKLQGPEDFAYDSSSQVIYTGCGDGWIKRVWLNSSSSETVVDDWVNTGGRPLGIALGLNNELIVADAFKGLLNVSREGAVDVLADEVNGVKLKLNDGHYGGAALRSTYKLRSDFETNQCAAHRSLLSQRRRRVASSRFSGLL
ncbi:Protein STRICTOSIDINE SYNTHASE-LIKE 4 [Hibiscus syriacus]|uniref:Protein STRICTOSIDINE SYNTHASE-LIKE 4 n=1 Tax=Hibiscus syriacus TaxID=106335 RepID=A0A6A2ZNZ7_HIBSY|nr:Protein STRICTOSIDINE SYNTHASE-LIKE 4 [Hibiscus syriacus]